jgi:IPT/TIG domain
MVELLTSHHCPVWRSLTRLVLCVGAAVGLHAAMVAPAQASTSCTAVNSGAFNLTGTALGASSSSTLFAWAVGDQITLTLVSSDGISRTDGLYNGSFTALQTTAVPTTGSKNLTYTVVSADLTNGILVDPENNDSVTATCTPAAPVPTVSSVSPNTGLAAGGTVVSIIGTSLGGATAVNFGGNAATSVTVNSATSVTATSPAGSAGVVDVTVTTPSGTSMTSAADQFTYLAPPTVTGVSPNNGPTAGATVVNITGTNLTGATKVNFGANAATSVTVTSATSITATSPAGSAGVVDVTVITPNGTSATSAGDRFTYFPPRPIVTSISPSNGPTAGGTSVTITGANFTGATAVKFGAATATFALNSAGQITANSPAASGGTVDVTVTTPGGTSATSASDQFSYGLLQTWVSVSGSDSNDCSRATPCMTFAGAFPNTIPGGEIDVLTPGDYGPLTITKAISIYNGVVGVAGVLVSGTSAIVIQAGATDIVNLRGLTLDGGGASNDGVLITTAGRVNIGNCVIQGFATVAGINVSPATGSVNVRLENSTVLNNKVGVIIAPANGATTNVSINRTHIDNNNGGGVRSDGTSGGSILTNISNSSIIQNAGNGVSASSGTGGSVTVSMSKDLVAFNNATGVLSNQAGGGIATVTSESSQIYGNGVGLQSISGGAVLSHLDNDVSGNASDGAFTGSIGSQ